MISILMALAMVTPTVAQQNAGAAQMDRLIDQIETLQDDADATGNTARTRPPVKAARKGGLVMTFGKEGPTVR
jgi:hypothetical protein